MGRGMKGPTNLGGRGGLFLPATCGSPDNGVVIVVTKEVYIIKNVDHCR